jgi:hypothetical protein
VQPISNVDDGINALKNNGYEVAGTKSCPVRRLGCRVFQEMPPGAIKISWPCKDACRLSTNTRTAIDS